MPSIDFHSVSKIYSRQSREFVWRFLLEALGQRKAAPHRALNDLSVRIGSGEAVGVLGHNGAGKTTLLNLIAGLTIPEEGEVVVGGKVCAMMELGSGFHPDLTGRENVWINGALLGLSRREMERSFNRIVEFSELTEFIEEPIRTYSQGMILRLGFSVVVHARPDILLIDELLAVGDQSFQVKCLEYLTRMRDEGRILVCVSHNPEELKRLCSRGILLDHGRLMADGPIQDVLEEYASRKQAVAGGSRS